MRKIRIPNTKESSIGTLIYFSIKSSGSHVTKPAHKVLEECGILPSIPTGKSIEQLNDQYLRENWIHILRNPHRVRAFSMDNCDVTATGTRNVHQCTGLAFVELAITMSKPVRDALKVEIESNSFMYVALELTSLE